MPTFEWIASSPYFGLRSSQPIIEEPSPRGRVIRVFPCGLRDHVIELSWFQTHAGGSSASLTAGQVGQWLGGTFKIHLPQSQQDNRDSPLFLVGPHALALDSLPLRLQKFQPDEVHRLFDVNKSLNADRETLARVLNLNSQIQSHQFSARTLVYFLGNRFGDNVGVVLRRQDTMSVICWTVEKITVVPDGKLSKGSLVAVV